MYIQQLSAAAYFEEKLCVGLMENKLRTMECYSRISVDSYRSIQNYNDITLLFVMRKHNIKYYLQKRREKNQL